MSQCPIQDSEHFIEDRRIGFGEKLFGIGGQLVRKGRLADASIAPYATLAHDPIAF